MPDSEDTKEWLRQFIKCKKDTRKETFEEWADGYEDAKSDILGACSLHRRNLFVGATHDR